MTSYIIKGETGDWELTMGLEVHCQIISKSKLFSGSSTEFGADPNTHVSLYDAAYPGMLPLLNSFCITQAIETGLALNGTINERSVFDRKNYFYADLPSSYQITQLFYPIMTKGFVEIDLADGSSKKIGINRLHIEQDAAKLMHDQHPSYSLVDLNRSGIGLMEIVTEPELQTPEEVGAYLRKLRAILRCIETCDGNMDEGSMRCDANVSVRKVGEKKLGTRVEIKNVNSVRFAMQAIEYEARRQVDLIESGGKVVQETRLFDSNKGETRSMRSKEFATDYRYFPDPDLPPLVVSKETIEKIRKSMPELPDAQKKRFMKDYGLSLYDSSILIAEKETAAYFEKAAKGRSPQDAKKITNWIMGDLFAALNKLGKSVLDCPVAPEHLGKLIDLISKDVISGRIAKEVFEIMMETGKDPEKIVDEKGLKQVTDTGSIEQAIEAVMKEHPDKVNEYRSGKDKLLGWFTGQVMKATGGKANPGMLNELLKKKLSK